MPQISKKKIVEVVEGYVIPHNPCVYTGQRFGIPTWDFRTLYHEPTGESTRKIRITIGGVI